MDEEPREKIFRVPEKNWAHDLRNADAPNFDLQQLLVKFVSVLPSPVAKQLTSLMHGCIQHHFIFHIRGTSWIPWLNKERSCWGLLAMLVRCSNLWAKRTIGKIGFTGPFTCRQATTTYIITEGFTQHHFVFHIRESSWICDTQEKATDLDGNEYKDSMIEWREVLATNWSLLAIWSVDKNICNSKPSNWRLWRSQPAS